MFVMPDHRFTEHHSLAEVAAYAPQSVICLLSALQFHGIGTQMPHAVWIAIANKGHVPRVPTTPVEVVRMAPAALRAGIEEHTLEGVPARIFSAAKTVADCFKYRSSVGVEVALEALRDGLAQQKFTPADLYEYAVIDRVWGVMRPYVEALA
jgi:predicted transcriptional regulator of viral defense system